MIVLKGGKSRQKIPFRVQKAVENPQEFAKTIAIGQVSRFACYLFRPFLFFVVSYTSEKCNCLAILPGNTDCIIGHTIAGMLFSGDGSQFVPFKNSRHMFYRTMNGYGMSPM